MCILFNTDLMFSLMDCICCSVVLFCVCYHLFGFSAAGWAIHISWSKCRLCVYLSVWMLTTVAHIIFPAHRLDTCAPRFTSGFTYFSVSHGSKCKIQFCANLGGTHHNRCTQRLVRDLQMNSHCIPKTRSVWPYFESKSLAGKVGMKIGIFKPAEPHSPHDVTMYDMSFTKWCNYKICNQYRR